MAETTQHTYAYAEPTSAELLQSALYFIRSVQEQTCDYTYTYDSTSDSDHNSRSTPTHISQSQTHAPSNSTSVPSPQPQPTHFPMHTPTSGTIIDRRRSSSRLAQLPTRATYSPRSSVSATEWDGKAVSNCGGGAARIYRLNPSPGEWREGFVPYRVLFKD